MIGEAIVLGVGSLAVAGFFLFGVTRERKRRNVANLWELGGFFFACVAMTSIAAYELTPVAVVIISLGLSVAVVAVVAQLFAKRPRKL